LPGSCGGLDPSTSSGSAGAIPEYARTTLDEADHVARFIAGCYAVFPRFEAFTAWSMFYFAAASFSEMCRRLHGDSWSRGFLLSQDERFVAAMRGLSPARPRPADLKVGLYGPSVAAAIEPINVAGLADPAKRNWYGVDVEDAVRAAHKLNAGTDAIRRTFTVTSAHTTATTMATDTT